MNNSYLAKVYFSKGGIKSNKYCPECCCSGPNTAKTLGDPLPFFSSPPFQSVGVNPVGRIR